MSKQEEKNEATLASALGVDLSNSVQMLEKFALDAFVERLAEQGIPISSQEELDQAIKLSQFIDEAAARNVQNEPSMFKGALDKLSSVVGTGHTEVDNHARAERDAVMAKCASYAADETVAAHILSLLDMANHSNTEGQE